MCSLSDGGRFFSGIAVISKYADGFVYATADDGGALDIPDLDELLVSADGGPTHQLLLPRWLGVYPGAAPGPIDYDIYSYVVGKLVRADQQFACYYRNVLFPDLMAKIAALRVAAPSGNPGVEARRESDIDAREKSIQAMLQTISAR